MSFLPCLETIAQGVDLCWLELFDVVGDVYGGYGVLQQSSVSMVNVVVVEKIDCGRQLGLWASPFSPTRYGCCR